MEAANSPTPGTGMWAPYVPPVIGEPLDTLYGVPAFVLVDAQVRPAVDVEFLEEGEKVKKSRRPVDLTVATAEAGVTRTFSGFAVGIVGQVLRLDPGNLPALCHIVESGRTRELALLELLAPDADVAVIARAQSTPIMPRRPDPVDAP